MERFEDIWQIVYTNLKNKLSQVFFDIWVKAKFEDSCAALLAKFAFKKKILNQNFIKFLCDVFKRAASPVEI